MRRLLPRSLLERYVWAVVFIGCASVVVSLRGATSPDSTGAGLTVGLLVLGLVVGEFFPTRIWRGDGFRIYTFSGTFTLALVMLGPLWLALLVQLSALLVEDLKKHRRPLKVAFNVSQYAVSIAAARITFAELTGQSVAGASGHFVAGDILPSLAAAAVYFTVNVTLVAIVLALAEDQPVLPVVAGHLREEVAMTTMLLCVAPVVLLCLQFSLLMAPLCLLPILAVRQSARTSAINAVQALHDGLTGLPNRALLLQRAERARLAHREGEEIALLLLDLDHFKEVNDTLGHHVGDELLRLVARRLEVVVRPGDTVSRLGGDEFAVLCPEISDPDMAEALATRLVDALKAPFPLDQISLHIEASIGIACFPRHADGVEQLVQRADVALYRAKTDRGTTQVYDSRHDFNSVERLALMGQFRDGLHSQLVLHYQPKCRSDDGRPVGVEALVRWEHPQRGLLAPAQFLPAAENAGLIVPMTMLILDQALRQAARWRDDGLDLNVAVNISPRHLTDIDFPPQLAALLAGYDLPGNALTLEVTESSMMSDPIRAAQVLRRIRALDIAVSIDDFGTGYSSLTYLRDLSATEVKIDRSFVHNAQHDERDLAIVKAAADLGHTLGLLVVAEGVENSQTAALMARSGCDLLQGYLILPPAPAAEVAEWCRQPQVWTRSLPAQVHRRAAEM